MKTLLRASSALLCASALGIATNAQVLFGTTWAFHDASSSPVGYFRFDPGFLLASFDNVDYFPVSTYEETGNAFSIVDVENGACPLDQEGHYTFVIADDTLHWTLVSDPCVIRTPSFVDFYWVNPATAIKEGALSSTITVAPNPVDDVIRIHSAIDLAGTGYHLLDLQGQEVANGTVPPVNAVIPSGHLTSGLYILRVDRQGLAPVRVVKR